MGSRPSIIIDAELIAANMLGSIKRAVLGSPD